MKSKPQKQGAQDGACGFYSVGNALSLLCPKVPVDDIFYEIFKYYIENGNATHFIKGMYRNKLNEILSHTVDVLNKDGLDVKIYRPFWSNSANGISEYKQVVWDHFEKQGRAVAIIGYEYCKNDPEDDYFSHWTTINKTSLKSLYTFDSSGERKYIPFSMCRLWDDKQKHKSKPYKIDSNGTFLISR